MSPRQMRERVRRGFTPRMPRRRAMVAGSTLLAATLVAAGAYVAPAGATSGYELQGAFAGIANAVVFGSATVTGPASAVVGSAWNDQVNATTLVPDNAVDTTLAGLGVTGCTLTVTSLPVTITGASPATIDVAGQIGPVSSALPLDFTLPPVLNVGPLTASSPGQVVTQLQGVQGTIVCFTGSGSQSNPVSLAANGKTAMGTTLAVPAGPPGTINGTVTDSGSNPVGSAVVSACSPTYGCTGAVTAPDGSYSINVWPDTYSVLVEPPSPTLLGALAGQTVVNSGGTNTVNAVLSAPAPLPPNVTLGDNTNQAGGTTTTEFWGTPFSMQVTGCPGGTATWSITGLDADTEAVTTLSGPMAEGPPGTYSADAPALSPVHGPVTVSLDILCPDGTTQTNSFPVYIDPSGTIVDQNGTPVGGATVTLLQAATAAGPFTPVPNGDAAVMSPGNTNNPDTTSPEGRYGWDVAPGFYKIEATATGCNTVKSHVLDIGPPVEGLTLTLTCTPSTTTGAIGGTVTDAKTHVAIAGACVVVRDESHTTVATLDADTSGHYGETITAGTYTIEARDCAAHAHAPTYYGGAPEYATSPQTVAVAAGTALNTLDIALPESGQIAGNVESAAKPHVPASGVCVEAEVPGTQEVAAKGLTGASGTFSLTGILPGTYVLYLDPCTPGSPYTATTGTKQYVVKATKVKKAKNVKISG